MKDDTISLEYEIMYVSVQYLRQQKLLR